MFLLLPVAVDYRAARHPVVTYSLLGACVGLFLLNLLVGLAGGAEGFEAMFMGLALVPSEGNRWHTWITSLFMHAGLFHLLGNMVYLYLFGASVEDVVGRGGFVGFYLTGGVLASLAHVLVTPDGFSSEIPLVGASGAISACMGAFAVLLRRAQVEFRFLYFFVFAAGSKEFHLPAWLVMSVWFLNDVLGMFLSIGDEGGGVAFAAHVGGFLFGSVVGAGMRARGWRPDDDLGPSVSRVMEPVVTRRWDPTPRTASGRAPAPIRIKVREVREVREGDPVQETVLKREIAGEVPVEGRVTGDGGATLEERGVYVWVQGAQAGPFRLEDIAEQLADGRLPGDTLLWDEGLQTWKPAVDGVGNVTKD
jgi:membrane associated rhomboid family serine protease